MLDGREGLDGTDVLRLVKETLTEGAPTGLFEVADRSPRAPEPEAPAPPFVGRGWSDARSFWLYQPDDAGAHVKAFPLGEDWHLDLWSGRGPLLAFGKVPAEEVAALAPALIAEAGTWERDLGEYAWRRFANTAQAVRDGARPDPDRARVRAALATSPTRAQAGPSLSSAVPPPSARPATVHLSR